MGVWNTWDSTSECTTASVPSETVPAPSKSNPAAAASVICHAALVSDKSFAERRRIEHGNGAAFTLVYVSYTTGDFASKPTLADISASPFVAAPTPSARAPLAMARRSGPQTSRSISGWAAAGSWKKGKEPSRPFHVQQANPRSQTPAVCGKIPAAQDVRRTYSADSGPAHSGHFAFSTQEARIPAGIVPPFCDIDLCSTHREQMKKGRARSRVQEPCSSCARFFQKSIFYRG